MPIKNTTPEKEINKNTKAEVNTRKRILITSADKGMPYWLNETKLVLEKYAKKCNAELLVLPKTKRRNNTWVIFDAWEKSIELGEDNDYVWIDADILITSDAPDVFSLDQRFFVCQPDPFHHVNPKWNKHHKRHGVPNAKPYPVTAIVKWNTRHIMSMLEWVNENAPQYPARYGDQELVAAAIYHCEVNSNYLPANWHKMSRWMKKDTKFFHYAGGNKGNKSKKIKSFCSTNRIKLS